MLIEGRLSGGGGGGGGWGKPRKTASWGRGNKEVYWDEEADLVGEVFGG